MLDRYTNEDDLSLGEFSGTSAHLGKNLYYVGLITKGSIFEFLSCDVTSMPESGRLAITASDVSVTIDGEIHQANRYLNIKVTEMPSPPSSRYAPKIWEDWALKVSKKIESGSFDYCEGVKDSYKIRLS